MLLRLLSGFFKPRVDVDAVQAEGLAHYGRGDFETAERCFREVAQRAPDSPEASANLAVALLRLQRHADAVPILLRVMEMQPRLAGAHYDLGVCYNRLRRNAEAIRSFERAIALEPGLHKAHASLVDAYLDCCDWDAVERWRETFFEYRARQPRALWAQRVEPFTALTLFPGEIAKDVAEQSALDVAQSVVHLAPFARRDARQDARIRVGYVSADLFDHATAHLTYGLYGSHDRKRFEVYVYSSGHDDGSHYRRHIAETSDRFVDIRNENAEATARRIAADGIDILVDMKGYTAHSRPRIFALRPAPVQASWLGYPGTMGARFIDYFISDAIATPPDFDGEFTECVVRLPDSCQVNDSRQPIAQAARTRADEGLPESGFVYCSFNNFRKIDRRVFSVWMDILRAVPGSVLWLLHGDPEGERNLERAAAAAGIAGERLVFARTVPKPEHLARHRLADLFLDTSACNAHTGASDALWSGLPILTTPGRTFIVRVAASVLHACGMGELAVHDLHAYRDAAIRYGTDRDALAAVTAKLRAIGPGSALFDTRRFVRNLEAAYERMHAGRLAGRAPESFNVTDA